VGPVLCCLPIIIIGHARNDVNVGEKKYICWQRHYPEKRKEVINGY